MLQAVHLSLDGLAEGAGMAAGHGIRGEQRGSAAHGGGPVQGRERVLLSSPTPVVVHDLCCSNRGDDDDCAESEKMMCVCVFGLVVHRGMVQCRCW